MKNMKKTYVTKAFLPPIDEYIEEISDIWDTHWLTNMGKKHNELEKELCEKLGVSNVSLVCNGHMALELSMQAMELSGEVITSPFTFASTTHAIVRNGLKPVFCDIDPNDYTIDVNKIESLITKETSAILPIHVYGNICDVDSIRDIADKYGLKVIYDAAHTFGESINGIGIGNFGDASCFSFHATKVFNTIEGGAVCYKDKVFGEKIYQLKNFGIKDEETVDGVGANAKMNEFCASMGLCNLRHIDDEIAKRKEIYDAYYDNLKMVKGIKLNNIQKGVKSNYAYFPIKIEDEYGLSRNELHRKLLEDGIVTRKYFYPLTSGFDCFNGVFNPSDTPVALDISNRILTLPIYSDLEIDTVNLVCKKIKEK